VNIIGKVYFFRSGLGRIKNSKAYTSDIKIYSFSSFQAGGRIKALNFEDRK
jgi:hypothetical protein